MTACLWVNGKNQLFLRGVIHMLLLIYRLRQQYEKWKAFKLAFTGFNARLL